MGFEPRKFLKNGREHEVRAWTGDGGIYIAVFDGESQVTRSVRVRHDALHAGEVKEKFPNIVEAAMANEEADFLRQK